MEYEEYLKSISTKNIKRWVVVFVFFIGVTGLSILPLLTSISTGGYFLFMVLFIIVGAILMVYYIILPYFKQVNPPNLPDTIVEPQQPESTVFLEEIRVTIIYWFTMPGFLVFLAFVPIFVFQEEYTQAIIFLGSALFFLMIALLFDTLIIVADPTKLKVSTGPLSTVFDLQNIDSIRPTFIRPWRDYMGFGKRVGPDGSLGYIAPMNTAVRIELVEGKTHVITLRKTQELTNFVRYYRGEEYTKSKEN